MLRYHDVGPSSDCEPGAMTFEQVVREAIEAEHDTTVLDGPVWTDQLEADQADLGTRGPADELAQPVALGNLSVVVDEHEHLAACPLCGGVVDRRVVEVVVPPLDLEVEPDVSCEPSRTIPRCSSVRPPLSTMITSKLRVVGARDAGK